MGGKGGESCVTRRAMRDRAERAERARKDLVARAEGAAGARVEPRLPASLACGLLGLERQVRGG